MECYQWKINLHLSQGEKEEKKKYKSIQRLERFVASIQKVNTMQHLERETGRGQGQSKAGGVSKQSPRGHDGCVMATQSQHLRQSEIPRQVGGNTIHGISSRRGSLY
ncbi:hypothetical protein PAMP_020597 [Pampus punctatissimus]